MHTRHTFPCLIHCAFPRNRLLESLKPERIDFIVCSVFTLEKALEFFCHIFVPCPNICAMQSIVRGTNFASSIIRRFSDGIVVLPGWLQLGHPLQMYSTKNIFWISYWASWESFTVWAPSLIWETHCELWRLLSNNSLLMLLFVTRGMCTVHTTRAIYWRGVMNLWRLKVKSTHIL